MAEKARTFLLKIGAVAGSPVTLAGAQTNGLTINNEMVDITNKDSAGIRTLLEGAGTQSLTLTINGVFEDGASMTTFRLNSLNNTIDAYSLFYDNGDTLEGNFQIVSFENTGDFNTELQFSATLENSGVFTYTDN